MKTQEQVLELVQVYRKMAAVMEPGTAGHMHIMAQAALLEWVVTDKWDQEIEQVKQEMIQQTKQELLKRAARSGMVN